MKYIFWCFGLIMAGLFGVAFIVMFQSITVNNESEYYVLKEAMEAAMLESVDISCYRNKEAEGCGEVIKISEQKFVENFTRRFVASANGDVTQYQIEFYDIMESPPKASVVIKGKTKSYNLLAQDGSDSFEIVNSLDGILIYDEVPTEYDVSPDTEVILEAETPQLDVETETKVGETIDTIETEATCTGSLCDNMDAYNEVVENMKENS